jgi:diguanylate cyclase (GGDEF)-like protein/PAS domain S-box-containing protein
MSALSLKLKKNSVLFQLLIWFLPFALLVIASSVYLYKSEEQREFIAQSLSENAKISLAKGAVEQTLEGIYSDTYLVAQNLSLQELITNKSSGLTWRFLHDLRLISQSRKHYDEISWIDETGMERARVHFNGNHTNLIPEEKLTNRSTADYFTRTLGLNAGEIYVTPHDLNAESAESAHKRILRIATPVVDINGYKHGVIVFNCPSEILVQKFISSALTGDEHAMLVNRDGYYLEKSPGVETFSNPPYPDTLSIANSKPVAWQHIGGHTQGQFMSADGLWTFATIYPASITPSKRVAYSTDFNATQNLDWKVVRHIPQAQLLSRTKVLGERLIPVSTLLLGLIFFSSLKHARTHVRAQLAETDLRIAATAFESEESMIITDSRGIILKVNQVFTATTGYTSEEAVGKTPSLLKTDRHSAEFYHEMWRQIKQTGKWQGEIWDKRKNGEIYPKLLNIYAVKGKNGVVTHYVGSYTDLTERKMAEEKIISLAFYDTLTGLPNRRLLLDRLNYALASGLRTGKNGALLFIDLDKFKTLNDTLGHDIGDLLLKQVAHRLKACVREIDTVARIGGDEFVVMLEDLNAESVEAAAQTEVIGEKILAALRIPYQLLTNEFHSSVSIGISLFSNNGQSQDEPLKQADIAMYQAKKSGRNKLRFFDQNMQDTISSRANLEAELRKALENKQLQLHYQIQVDSAHQTIGAEVLLRWIHPVSGIISPAQFVPIAEETGLILPIGLWVLETACAQLKKWQDNPATAQLILAINVSARQFHQNGFATEVRSVIERHDINPALLKLELTEGMLLNNLDDTIATMRSLQEFGVQFSLDDFGTGYSSLQYLKRLPLAQLKIDQSFVRDLATCHNDQAIVRTIIAMAHSLNLNVIAEGVETEIQRQILLENQCSHYQGYLFGKPMPIEQFESLLSNTSTSMDCI